LRDAVDAALADGLADINAAVANLESQIDNIATGEDVDNFNDALDGVEQDLADLLASNNVFTGNLTINSDATLEFADSLKDKVAIINGNVTVLAQTSMDPAKLNTVTTRIKTITGNLTVVAAASSAPVVAFDSLGGVGNLKIAQAEALDSQTQPKIKISTGCRFVEPSSESIQSNVIEIGGVQNIVNPSEKVQFSPLGLNGFLSLKTYFLIGFNFNAIAIVGEKSTTVFS
jgi:hypothetical protein